MSDDDRDKDPRIVAWEAECKRPRYWDNLGSGRFRLRKEYCAPSVEVLLEPECANYINPRPRYTIEIKMDGSTFVVRKPTARKTKLVSLASAKYWGKHYGTGQYRALV